MLGHDKGEQRLLERVGGTLQLAEVVTAAIVVMRREDDEATLRQPGPKRLVGGISLAFRVLKKDVGRKALQPVLTDDDGPLFALLQILRQEQIAPQEHVRKD